MGRREGCHATAPDTMASVPRICSSLLPVLLLAALAGCGRSVPATPRAARTQAIEQPFVAWRGEGRITVSWPGGRLSADCWLRRAEPTAVRVAIVGDGGLTLADLEIGAGGATIHAAVSDLRPRLQPVIDLLTAAYGPADEQCRRWQNGRLRVETTSGARWYGGDPLLLRRADGPGSAVWLADYRPLAGLHIAHDLSTEGIVEIVIRIRAIRPLTATPTTE
ncbi:MAG: hypothetical protein H0W72_04165 [Planctomycetes bacterium]|nr:hypothetical protein [Planctomycetota bacterium]